MVQLKGKRGSIIYSSTGFFTLSGILYSYLWLPQLGAVSLSSAEAILCKIHEVLVEIIKRTFSLCLFSWCTRPFPFLWFCWLSSSFSLLWTYYKGQLSNVNHSRSKEKYISVTWSVTVYFLAFFFMAFSLHRHMQVICFNASENYLS